MNATSQSKTFSTNTAIVPQRDPAQRGDVVRVTVDVLIPKGASMADVHEWLDMEFLGRGIIAPTNPLIEDEPISLTSIQVEHRGMNSTYLDARRQAVHEAREAVKR